MRLLSYLLLSLLLTCWYGIVTSQTQFIVTLVTKVPGDPFFNVGFESCYAINGIHQPVLNLTIGTTYTFTMSSLSSIHPFYLTTSSSGADGGANAISVSGNGASGSSSIVFTPDATTSMPLYFECGNHENMGNRLNIVAAFATAASSSGTFVGSSSSLGITQSSLSASSSSSSVNTTQSSSGLSFATSTASDIGSSNQPTGSSTSVASSSSSAVITPVVYNIGVTQKVAGDPFFGSGFSDEFTLNGIHAPQITMVRGTTYTLVVDVPSIHPFYLTTDSMGGNGDSNLIAGGVTSATFTFSPDSSTPNTIYYQCEVHMLMGNAIQIVSSGSSSGMGQSNVGKAANAPTILLVATFFISMFILF